MGAEFCQRTFDGSLTHDQLRQEFQDTVAEMGHDRGHGYSGTWVEASGLKITSQSFPTIDQASDYLQDKAEKWGPVMAVKARIPQEGKGFPQTKADHALVEKKTSLTRELMGYPAAIITRSRQAKSKTVGCKHCSSQISRQHLRGTDCPVCRQNLLVTATDQKKIDSLKSQLADLTTKMAARELELMNKTSNTVWVLGAWCSC
jgi:hypothetical protein